MSTIAIQRKTIGSLLQNPFKKFEDMIIHVPTSKETRNEKIRKWDKKLPVMNLTLKQEKSIYKGYMEAKQRKGEYI